MWCILRCIQRTFLKLQELVFLFQPFPTANKLWYTLYLQVERLNELCYIVLGYPVLQKMVLVSSASENLAPTQQTLEISPPADLDKTTTELADWLALIDQMLKSNIVTVGNGEEINRTIARMKVCVSRGAA